MSTNTSTNVAQVPDHIDAYPSNGPWTLRTLDYTTGQVMDTYRAFSPGDVIDALAEGVDACESQNLPAVFIVTDDSDDHEAARVDLRNVPDTEDSIRETPPVAFDDLSFEEFMALMLGGDVEEL